MSFYDYLNAALSIYNERGASQMVREGSYFAYENALRQKSRLFRNNGEYVYDYEWDVLIVLDACRPDLYEDTVTNHSYENVPDKLPINTIRSRASSSQEWMVENFSKAHSRDVYDEEIRQTTHITGNPFSAQELRSVPFKELVEVWEHHWSDDSDYLPARPLTDIAINRYRNTSPNRMIIHYMQPHVPFITERSSYSPPSQENWGEMSTQKTPWEQLRDNEVSFEQVWADYKETLHYVLQDVELLLQSINAENVVITADHGNGLGEKGIYGHPRGINCDVLRTVPWVRTTAEHTNEYTPEIDTATSNTPEQDVAEKLSALGYK